MAKFTVLTIMLPILGSRGFMRLNAKSKPNSWGLNGFNASASPTKLVVLEIAGLFL